MGCYTYISDTDRVNWRKVGDEGINTLFQEALQIDKSLMISEHFYTEKRFLKKSIEKVDYTFYHECFVGDVPVYQARQQLSASGDKRVVMAYLYGIINGSKLNKN